MLTNHLPKRYGHLYGGGFRAGDVVVTRNPRDPSMRLCKRIVGMPGDLVFVDPTFSDMQIQVPNGHVWLQGDNIANSQDSRNFGPVPIALLVGRVEARIFPFNQACWIRSSEHEV